MTRIEREKKVVGLMIGIWCRGSHHHRDALCPECQQLLDYSLSRLDRCRFGNAKTSCRKCPVHCYRPGMREKIRRVMRYSGPRMVFRHPVDAIIHLIQK